MAVWEADSGQMGILAYLSDLRTSSVAVMHSECVIREHGAPRFVQLAQEHMIELASAFNNAALHISAQNDRLREHRLKPLDWPS